MRERVRENEREREREREEREREREKQTDTRTAVRKTGRLTCRQIERGRLIGIEKRVKER